MEGSVKLWPFRQIVFIPVSYGITLSVRASSCYNMVHSRPYRNLYHLYTIHEHYRQYFTLQPYEHFLEHFEDNIGDIPPDLTHTSWTLCLQVKSHSTCTYMRKITYCRPGNIRGFNFREFHEEDKFFEFKNLAKTIIMLALLKKNENSRILNFVKNPQIRNSWKFVNAKITRSAVFTHYK